MTDETPTADAPTEEKVEAKEEAKPAEKSADTNGLIEEAKKVNTEKKELLEREEKLQSRKEKLHAEEMVGGRGVTQGQPEKMNDLQYAEALQRGEVNPMKEDGYI